MSINIFGKQIRIKERYCARDNRLCGDRVRDPYINLYVQMSYDCNLNCKFCCAKNNKNCAFNLYKFKEVIQEVISKIELRKISFTGGEPLINSQLLLSSADYIKRVSPNTFTVVNTNGFRFPDFNAFKLNRFKQLFDSIALSHHHYDNETNNEIFVGTAIDDEQIKKLSLGNLHLSCNLIKGYIDSADEVIKYLEHAIDIGAKDVGFVTLMDIGGYSSKHRVLFQDTGVLSDDRFYRTQTWRNNSCCECYNLVYMREDGEHIHFYARQVLDNDNNNNSSNLVFDGQNLREGFNGPIIY